MTEATVEYTEEQNQELIDHIKGHRYYRVQLNGYGGEGAYIKLTKEQFEFWVDHDEDLVEYLLNAEDPEEAQYETLDEVPPEADFLAWKNDSPGHDGETYHSAWYDAPTEYEHSYGVAYDHANISVDEIDGEEIYDSNYVAEVMSYIDVSEVVNEVEEESDWTIEATELDECYASKEVEYICQMYSSEKGNFFDGVVTTTGDFDPKKLKFHLGEYDNGEAIIESVTYDGVEIDNSGGDTNGKGYEANVWKNS